MTNSSQQKKTQHRRFIRINGKLISKSFSRKADADRWYAEIKRQKELDEAGLDFKANGTPLSEYTERWLRTRLANGQPQSSYVQEEARMRLYVLPEFGGRDIDRVTSSEWERFINELGPKYQLGPATRNRIRAMLSKLYNDASRERLVVKNPITQIPKSKERSKKWDYWATNEECARYLESAKAEGIGFATFASLALNTGARVSELLALEHQDIDLIQRRIRIWRIVEAVSFQVCERTKGFNERWLGINDALFDALQKHRLESKFGKPSDPILADSRGKRLAHRFIRAMHVRTCKRAQVKVIRVHDLRHTFASHYVMNSGSLTELQGLLGHTSSAMTLKYAHLAPGFLEKRASVVSFASVSPASALALVRSR